MSSCGRPGLRRGGHGELPQRALFPALPLSTRTRVELSPRTTALLHSLTNQVHVILYYDKEDPLYGNISDLLKEYHLSDPSITIETVDYIRDPGAAQELKMQIQPGRPPPTRIW